MLTMLLGILTKWENIPKNSRDIFLLNFRILLLKYPQFFLRIVAKIFNKSVWNLFKEAEKWKKIRNLEAKKSALLWLKSHNFS